MSAYRIPRMPHNSPETVSDPLAYPTLCVETDERLRSLAREQQGISPTPVDAQEASVRTRLAPLVRALKGSGRIS